MILKLNGISQFTQWPITAPFGSIDSAHHTPHKGLDFAVNLNTPVPSFSDGVVKAIQDDGTLSFGRSVTVQMPNGDTVIYGHLNHFECQVGQAVHQGQLIGLSGNTGDSTGPHLHVQVMHHGQAVDPITYFHMSGDGGSTGVQWLDHWSEVWKQNAERIFHIPGEATRDDNVGWGILNALQDKFLSSVQHLGHILNQNSAEISTFAIIVCAFGVIVAPLIGSHPSKWYGRMTGAFFGGVIWRIAITATN